MNNPVIVTVRDMEFADKVMRIEICENEFTASRIKTKLEDNPLWKDDRYYVTIEFVKVNMEDDL